MSNISRLTEEIKEQTKENFKDFLLNTFLGDAFPQENILHRYRVFNYNVTLAIVSPQEFKSGSYRTRELDYIVFQSHGKSINPQPARAGSKTLDNLQNFLGILNGIKDNKWNFYLQDLYIRNAFTAKRDIGTEFRLKILEPYGADTFFSTILEGLRIKGYSDFGKGNAFILKLEFVGFRDDKETPELIPFSTRFYPLIISELKAEITQEGTVYDLKGVPMNDMARYNDVNDIPQDFKITGNTVKEILKGPKGLLNFLNNTLKSEKNAAKLKPVEYDIVFLDEKGRPTENGGDTVSQILNSKMYDPATSAGQRAFKTPDNEDYIKKVGLSERLSISEYGEMTFNVNGRLGISRIIDNLINDSHYVLDKVLNNFQGAFDKDGMVPWWRIVPKTEIIGFDDKKNTSIFKVIFQISHRQVPWQKLSSIFFPDTKSEPEEYEKFCARRYEWNYTGNNKDILNFRIHYDNLFVRLLTAKLGKTAASPGETSNAQGSALEQAAFDSGTSPYGEEHDPQTNAGNTTEENMRLSNSAKTKSLKETRPENSLARDINALLNNPFENVQTEIEILGDPMWLGTQFIDNISLVNPESSVLFTNDGGIAMRTIDPCIRVISYAPRDINADGFLASGTDQDKKISRWSAYYMVYEIESFFSGGVFKQKLKAVRLTDTDMEKAAKLASPLDIFGFKKMGAVL